VKAYLLIIVGLVLLALSAMKVIGLAHLLLSGTDKPPVFFVKQLVYAAVFLGMGGSAAQAGWRQRGGSA